MRRTRSLEDGLEALGQIILSALEGRSSVALLDFPNHGNVGDSAIWAGECRILRALGIKIDYCSDSLVARRTVKNLCKTLPMLLHGGGNLGDLYPRHQKLRESLLQNFPDRTIMQLPQSIYFSSTEAEETFFSLAKAHRHFFLMVRDYQSYELASRYLEERVFLVPDCAFALGKIPREDATMPVMGLLRQDGEISKEYSRDGIDQIPSYDWLHENTLLRRVVHRSRMLDRIALRGTPQQMKLSVLNWAAERRIRRGCRLLSQGHHVVTDRLHAHILSTLMGIPNIVLDNHYHKIRNFRNTWVYAAGLSQECQSIEKALMVVEGGMRASG